MKHVKHLLVTVMSEIVRYSIRGGGAKFGVFLSLFLALTVAVRADDIKIDDLPRPPPGMKPVFIVEAGVVYTNIGVPDAMRCYIPNFFRELSEADRLKILQGCVYQEKMAEYMVTLDKVCLEKKCTLTAIGDGVFSFDIYDKPYAGRPYFDPNSPQGVAAEWRDTILRMCKYHNDPSMAAHIPRPLKDYIDLLKEDPKFSKWVNGSCDNTKCAETLLDYETWKNGGKCETKATQLISDKLPNPIGRCENCRIVKAFVENYPAYEEAIRNPPVEQKPLVPQPAPSLVGPGSSKPGPGLTDMRPGPGPQNPQIPQPAPSLVGPGNQTRPGLYDRMRPYNPNWNGIVDSFGPMLIGAQDLYGAGTSLVLIGSGGVSPDRIPGQTMLTGVQGAAGTYMLIGGAGMALTSMGAPAIGGALIGAAAPAASIVLVPIVAGGVGYGAGNLLGGALTGGSMEGLADAVNVISVPAVGANCSQRVSFLGETQGAFCGTEGRMNNWISRDCAGCCNRSFNDLSGANADLAKCMSQNSNVQNSFTGACTEMCNK